MKQLHNTLYSLCLYLYRCRTPSVSVLLVLATLLRVLYSRETMKQLHLHSEQSQIFNSMSSTAVPPHSCTIESFSSIAAHCSSIVKDCQRINFFSLKSFHIFFSPFL